MKNIITSLVCCFLLSIPSSVVFSQSTADSLLNFIKQNKERASLYLKKNDTVIAALNENKLMPLASTVKIMVAIEFAKQAGNNVLNENGLIPLSELNKYYIPNTDGGAHPRWINYERSLGHIINDSVQLIDVARGMIIFSSNANTEFLMDLLGIDKIQNNIQLLGLKQHTFIYPLVSSLFLYQNLKKINEDKIISAIKKLNDEDYAKSVLLIHDHLKNDSNYKKNFRPQDLTLKMQKEWSDRLPASTTKDYVQVCSILNNRKFFDSSTYQVLAQVLETLMEVPANKAWLSHAGMKGGSTIFVLTKALYATLKNETKIEMGYFFNDLTGAENMRLQTWMNNFEIRVLTDEKFRKQMAF